LCERDVEWEESERKNWQEVVDGVLGEKGEGEGEEEVGID